MEILAGIVAALTLVGVTAASAQVVYYPYGYYGAPYPYSYYGAPYPAAPPVVVAPAPAPYAGAIPGPVPGSFVVNPYTGRWCTFQPDGYRWCWTP